MEQRWDLPLSEGELQNAEKFLERHDFAQVTGKLTTTFPSVNLNMITEPEGLERLNKFAQWAAEHPREQAKLKAALCREQPQTSVQLLDIVEHLQEYRFDRNINNSRSYALMYVRNQLGEELSEAMAQNAEGEYLLKLHQAECTSYGTISCRGGTLYQNQPSEPCGEREVEAHVSGEEGPSQENEYEMQM